MITNPIIHYLNRCEHFHLMVAIDFLTAKNITENNILFLSVPSAREDFIQSDFFIYSSELLYTSQD